MIWSQLKWVLTRLVLIPFRIVIFFLKAIFNASTGVVRGLVLVAKPAMRFLTYIFLIIAVISFVADLTPALNGVRDYSSTTLGTHWKDFAPNALQEAQKVITIKVGAWAWSSIAVILSLPTSFLFGFLAGLTAYAGRHRDKLEVFAN